MSATASLSEDTETTIRVLYAASSAADGEFVRAEVTASTPLLSITCATSAHEALDCFKTMGRFDAVLIDPELLVDPFLISSIRRDDPGVSIVACVAGDDETLARQALEAGADVWLPKRKDHLPRLYFLLRHAVDRRRAAAGPVHRVSTDERLETEHSSEALVATELADGHEATRDAAESIAYAAVQANRAERDREAARRRRESERALLSDHERALLSGELAGLHGASASRLEVPRTDEPAPVESRHAEREGVESLAGRESRADTGRLISAVTDDVDAILGEISRASGNLCAQLPEHAAPQDAVARLNQAVLDGRGFTNMLRAFARREAQDAGMLDLNGLIEGMRPTLVRLLDEEVQLACELTPGLDRVAMESRQLELALVSIMAAVRSQFLAGGRVTIRTSQVSGDDRSTNGAPHHGRPSHTRLSIEAVAWRQDVAILRLATDRWFAPARQWESFLDLSQIDGFVKAHGGWLEMDTSLPHRLVIVLGLSPHPAS